MKGSIVRAVLLVLLASLALVLFSCSEDKIVQNGIEISEGASSYSPETKARAQDVIFSLLKGYLEKTTAVSLPQATLDSLSAHAERVRVITEGQPMTEQQYCEMLSLLEKEGERVIDELVSGEASEATLSLYRELSLLVSPDYVGKTLYHTVDYIYEYKYEENMRDYEQYGYEFLLIDAMALQRERQILQKDIGESSFSSATRAFYFVAALAKGGVHEQEVLSGFSDEEILLLVKSIRFSLGEITPEGWELLLSHLPATDNGSYASRLLAKAKENGDVGKLSSVMGEMLALLASCRESLDTADVEHIRGMDAAALLKNAFEELDQEDWQRLERITTVPLVSADYEAVAAEYFGEDFTAYAAEITPATIEELRQSVGTEDFSKTLEEYIAGISPALSYVWR